MASDLRRAKLSAPIPPRASSSTRLIQSHVPMVEYLKGSNPVIKLQQAARDGREDVVRAWLERLPRRFGSNIEVLNQRDEEGYTALHYAARFNRLTIMQMLVVSGADPTVLSGDRQTALHLAAKHLPRYQTEATDTLANPRFASSRAVIEYLVHTCQSDVNVRDSYGLTPLHIACARGNLAAVEVLLESANIDVNLPDNKGDSPLHEACVSGSVPIIQRLLQSPHINILAQDNEKMTPLHIACREGHVEVVKTIFQYGTERIAELVKAVDNELNTPFHLACESGEPEVVQMLLSHGADVGAKRINDKSPMHLAAEGGYVEVAKILFEAGGESTLRAIDDHLCTPLHDAAKNNHVEMIEFLLSRGANVNGRDDDSYTPLLTAASLGEVEAFRALMEDPHVQLDAMDKKGKSAVFLAAEEGHVDILECLLSHPIGAKLCSTADAAQNTPLHIAAGEGKLGVVSILLRVGVQVDARNEVNKTPIHLAAENGHAAVVARLIEHDPDTAKDEDEDSNTPLHCACSHGHLSVAKVLLEANTRLDARNASLWTPVDCASAGGWAAIVELLADAQADVCTTDKPNKVTPLHLACREGNVQVVEVLMQNGASVAALDQDGLNCLEVAIENGQTDVAMTIIKSNQWDQALRNSCGSETPLRKMIQKMPDVAEEVLNRCMHSNASRDGPISVNSPEYRVEFVYEFLDDYRDSPSLWDRLRGRSHDAVNFKSQRSNDEDNASIISVDMMKDPGYSTTWGPIGFSRLHHPIHLMTHSGAVKLLAHPVVVTLVNLKWKRFACYMFVINIVMYMSFLALLTSYALTLPKPARHMCSSLEICNGTLPDKTVTECGELCNISCIGSIDPKACEDHCGSKCHFVHGAAVVIIIVATVLLLIKFFQLFSLRFIRYFKDLSSFIAPVLYLGAIIFSCTFNTPCLCIPDWQWQIGVITIFAGWISLLFYLRRLPVVGIYVVLFFNICRNSLKVLCVLATLVVGCGLALNMLFYNDQHVGRVPYPDPYRSMSTVMSHLQSEFGHMVLFKEDGTHVDDIQYKYMTFIVWIFVWIFISILMPNMMVGVAVADIKGQAHVAALQKLALKVEWVLSIEELLPMKLRRRMIVGKRVIQPYKPRTLLGNLKKLVWRDNLPEGVKMQSSSSVSLFQDIQQHNKQLADDVVEMKRKLNEFTQALIEVVQRQGQRIPFTTTAL
ncbi:hypothetical protein EMCRGX_G019417 [Ephydatia muelleri]